MYICDPTRFPAGPVSAPPLIHTGAFSFGRVQPGHISVILTVSLWAERSAPLGTVPLMWRAGGWQNEVSTDIQTQRPEQTTCWKTCLLEKSLSGNLVGNYTYCKK